jgi:hypothetical protein
MSSAPLSPTKDAQAKVVEQPEKVVAPQPLVAPPHYVDLTRVDGINVDAVETFSAVFRMIQDWIVQDNDGKSIKRPLITEPQLLAAAPAAIEEAIVDLFAVIEQGAVSQEVQKQIFAAIFRNDPKVKVDGEHGRKFNKQVDDSSKISRTRLSCLLTPSIVSVTDDCNEDDNNNSEKKLNIYSMKSYISQLFCYVGPNIHREICQKKKRLADVAKKKQTTNMKEAENSAKTWNESKTIGTMTMHVDRRDRSSTNEELTTGKVFRHISFLKSSPSFGGSSALKNEEKDLVATALVEAFRHFHAQEGDTTVFKFLETTPHSTSSSSSSSSSAAERSASEFSSSNGITVVATQAASSSNAAAGNTEDEAAVAEEADDVAMSAVYDSLTTPLGVEDENDIAEPLNPMWYVPKIGFKSLKEMPTHFPDGKRIPSIDPTSSRLYLGDRYNPVTHIDTPEGHTLIALNTLLGVKPVILNILGFKVRFLISHCPGSPHPDYIRMVSQSKAFFKFILSEVVAQGGADNDLTKMD